MSSAHPFYGDEAERYRRFWRDRSDHPVATAPAQRAQITRGELTARLGGIPATKDKRTRARTDRDRILYSSAFRRLEGVTQVVSAVEGRVFHNRLTHSLKVAQLARSLADYLNAEQEDEVRLWGGLEPDVVEAAALAHDLGHPPFGHIAEEHLRQICDERGLLTDSFEGNAQSFRVVTRLAAHRLAYRGLDLTRATLNSLLKYPWPRGEAGKESLKFGVYDDDREAFQFARTGYPEKKRSLEAEVMDYSDDVAYSIHDLEDFCRAGLIPLDRLLHVSITPEALKNLEEQASGGAVAEAFYPQELNRVISEWAAEQIEQRDAGKPHVDPERIDRLRGQFRSILSLFRHPRGYTGSHEDRARIRVATSQLIDRFIAVPRIANDTESQHALIVDADERAQLKFLQHLVFRYVIRNPQLATQQAGQRRVIMVLWEEYFNAFGGLDSGWSKERIKGDMVPPSFRDDLKYICNAELHSTAGRKAVARLACDVVCSFSDEEALRVFRRLTGVRVGSVRDAIHY